MILDSKEQKDFLLHILQSVPISGNYATVSSAIKELEKLADAINGAGIEEVKE